MIVIAQAFNTELGFDFLCVGSTCYSGPDESGAYRQRNGATADPSSIVVAAGLTITWSSDYSVTKSGFQMCRGTPPPPPSPSPPVAPLPPGTLLDLTHAPCPLSSRRRFIPPGAWQWVSLLLRSCSSNMDAVLVCGNNEHVSEKALEKRARKANLFQLRSGSCSRTQALSKKPGGIRGIVLYYDK